MTGHHFLRQCVATLCLLGSGQAMAISGSNSFMCDLISYSNDVSEIREASFEAAKRGICGYSKPGLSKSKPRQSDAVKTVAKNVAIIAAILLTGRALVHNSEAYYWSAHSTGLLQTGRSMAGFSLAAGFVRRKNTGSRH